MRRFVARRGLVSPSLAMLICLSLMGCQTPLAATREIVEGPAPRLRTVGRVGDVVVRQRVEDWREVNGKNVVIQRYDYSCGAAALATMLQYYFEDKVDEAMILKEIFLRLAKQEKPNEELKDRVDNGLSMLDLLYAAKDLGYQGAVVRIPLKKLAESKAPVIVRIEKYGYKHFVVFRGIREDRVYLADPIRGNLRLPISEFKEQWSGESLFLGKAGFGLPDKYPLALDRDGPVRPELEAARRSQFPIY